MGRWEESVEEVREGEDIEGGLFFFLLLLLPFLLSVGKGKVGRGREERGKGRRVRGGKGKKEGKRIEPSL